jgi:hypothetical protein
MRKHKVSQIFSGEKKATKKVVQKNKVILIFGSHKSNNKHAYQNNSFQLKAHLISPPTLGCYRIHFLYGFLPHDSIE